MQSDEYDEDYHREKNIEYRGLAMDDRGVIPRLKKKKKKKKKKPIFLF